MSTSALRNFQLGTNDIMRLYRLRYSLFIGISSVLLSTSIVHADECLTYAQKSVEQNDRNLFNLCGYHGSQWSSNLNRWRNECQTMSNKDRDKRVIDREGTGRENLEALGLNFNPLFTKSELEKAAS